MKSIKCQNCHRTLLEASNFDELSIKCRRCGHFNNFLRTNQRTQSADHESHNTQDKTRGHSKTQAIQQSTTAICGSKA